MHLPSTLDGGRLALEATENQIALRQSLCADQPLFLQIASRRRPFPGPREASAIYRATIERYDRETGRGGASGVPACKIVTDAGEVVGHVSYNGRVWVGADYRPGAMPVYCPSAPA
jgi:hypothetical protein